MKRVPYILLLVCFMPFQWSHANEAMNRERLIVLTDIEADPDDTQSLVRLLLYSNSIDIKGIVATTSCWKRNSIAPESIRKVIRAYGEVQPNLAKHEPGFPSGDALLSIVKKGMPSYGMSGVGEDKDSEGSDWIIRELKKDDPRPLWISVWGGVNTLAQALYRIEAGMSQEEAGRLLKKLRVYTISDQDDSGVWIRKTFPGVFYIVSPGDNYGRATWNAINSVVQGWSNETISNAWIAENIQQGHGPLGASYPDVAWGFEGDTPAFLGIIPNGLNVPDHPEWGGWGGRYERSQPGLPERRGSSGVPYEPETRPIWTDTSDKYTPYVASDFGRAIEKYSRTFEGNKVTLWRWRDDFQNDFAARMDWCLGTFEEVNHPPVPVLRQPDAITVYAGKGIGLDASASTDPDGDSLSYLWFHYPEAGSYKEEITIGGAENAHGLWVTAPDVAKPETAHFILKLTDKGSPPLTRYKRVIVTILPREYEPAPKTGRHLGLKML